MNPGYHLTSFSLLEKFNLILERLAKDERNINLDESIISWCIELSLEKYFPKVSQEIIENKNLWIEHSIFLESALQLYRKLLVITDRLHTRGLGNITGYFNNISRRDFKHHIKELTNQMSIKSIVLLGFILTGIGLLLYLLKGKDNNNNIQSSINYDTQSKDKACIKEKHILVLLINSGYYQELIHSLKYKKNLQPEDSSKLYGATQDLWIGETSKFDRSQIKQALINCNPVNTTSEYDVNFVTIELDSDDSRFHPDVNPMDRRDAFIELGKRSPQFTVSPRLSCKAYENTEFYSR